MEPTEGFEYRGISEWHLRVAARMVQNPGRIAMAEKCLPTLARAIGMGVPFESDDDMAKEIGWEPQDRDREEGEGKSPGKSLGMMLSALALFPIPSLEYRVVCIREVDGQCRYELYRRA